MLQPDVSELRNPNVPVTESRGGIPALLLSDGDALERLTRLARWLESRRDEIVERWTDGYATILGSSASLSRAAFRRRFGSELEQTLDALIEGDVSRLAVILYNQGRSLATAGVPFAELAVTSYVFVERCSRQADGTRPDPRALCMFGQLRSLLFAEAYFDDRQRGEEALPTLREAEHTLIRRALSATAGNKLQAARRLGVSRKWLYARLREMT